MIEYYTSTVTNTRPRGFTCMTSQAVRTFPRRSGATTSPPSLCLAFHPRPRPLCRFLWGLKRISVCGRFWSPPLIYFTISQSDVHEFAPALRRATYKRKIRKPLRPERLNYLQFFCHPHIVKNIVFTTLIVIFNSIIQRQEYCIVITANHIL